MLLLLLLLLLPAATYMFVFVSAPPPHTRTRRQVVRASPYPPRQSSGAGAGASKVNSPSPAQQQQQQHAMPYPMTGTHSFVFLRLHGDRGYGVEIMNCNRPGQQHVSGAIRIFKSALLLSLVARILLAVTHTFRQVTRTSCALISTGSAEGNLRAFCASITDPRVSLVEVCLGPVYVIQHAHTL